MTERQKQALIEIATTIAILAVYWISMQPEWKLQMYGKLIRERFARPVPVDPDQLSQSQERVIQKFRRELSEWEHARKSGSPEN